MSSFKDIVTHKLFAWKKIVYIYIYIYMCVCVCVFKEDLALNNPQGLICHKTKLNHQKRVKIYQHKRQNKMGAASFKQCTFSYLFRCLYLSNGLLGLVFSWTNIPRHQTVVALYASLGISLFKRRMGNPIGHWKFTNTFHHLVYRRLQLPLWFKRKTFFFKLLFFYNLFFFSNYLCSFWRKGTILFWYQINI